MQVLRYMCAVVKKPTSSPKIFANRESIEQIEEGSELAPKFDESGLMPVTTTDFDSGEVLMMGYMNREALLKTIQSCEAHYWSRSRKILWHKGATSGLVQQVLELRIDDDQDCLWMRVRVNGIDGNKDKAASCHVGYRSCFYRSVVLSSDTSALATSALATDRVPPSDAHSQKATYQLRFEEKEKIFNPKKVYGDAPNPTQI